MIYREPRINELVLIRCLSITDYGVECQLIEFDKKGLINFSFLKRGKIRNIRSTVDLKRNQIGEVINNNNLIEVSLLDITENDNNMIMEQYKQNKKLESIFRNYYRDGYEEEYKRILKIVDERDKVSNYLKYLNSNRIIEIEEINEKIKEYYLEKPKIIRISFQLICLSNINELKNMIERIEKEFNINITYLGGEYSYEIEENKKDIIINQIKELIKENQNFIFRTIL
jgi:translation initiation factor 2 alpha subunit (eIF-2alpha)